MKKATTLFIFLATATTYFISLNASDTAISIYMPQSGPSQYVYEEAIHSLCGGQGVKSLTTNEYKYYRLNNYTCTPLGLLLLLSQNERTPATNKILSTLLSDESLDINEHCIFYKGKGVTALYHAVEKEDMPLIEMLLTRGASPHSICQNKKGEGITALSRSKEIQQQYINAGEADLFDHRIITALEE